MCFSSPWQLSSSFLSSSLLDVVSFTSLVSSALRYPSCHLMKSPLFFITTVTPLYVLMSHSATFHPTVPSLPSPTRLVPFQSAKFHRIRLWLQIRFLLRLKLLISTDKNSNSLLLFVFPPVEKCVSGCHCRSKLQCCIMSNNIIQTEAERRRRETGVQQSIENGLGSCMLYMFACTYGFRKYLAMESTERVQSGTIR